MTKFEVGKEYWVKAKYLKDDNYHFKPLLFEFGKRTDGASWIARDIEAVEAIPEREKVTIPKEIEKEPLYWVRDKKGYSLIIRNHSVTQRSSGSSVSYQEHHREFFTFTEKEIKDYDERFMAFAVPAEEER